jgi:hypothetical protein
MKKRVELDVDFIGGGQPPRKEEFIAISAFIKEQKEKRNKKMDKKTSDIKRTAKQPA